MQLPLPRLDDEPEILPARKLSGKVSGVFVAPLQTFVTCAAPVLQLNFQGISGDFHAGYTRRSGGREPWYPRGTEIRNERQITLMAEDEMAYLAAKMGIERIEPEWIGANIVVEGIRLLSLLPPRSQLFFEGGVTLRIDGANVPCKLSGGSIAEHYPDREQTELALSFPENARKRRGLVAWVEKPGTIVSGEAFSAQIPDQWIYSA